MNYKWDINKSTKKFDFQQINRYQIIVSAMSGSVPISDPRMGKPSLPNVLENVKVENVKGLSIIHKSGEVYKCKPIQTTTEIIFVFWMENINIIKTICWFSGVNEQRCFGWLLSRFRYIPRKIRVSETRKITCKTQLVETQSAWDAFQGIFQTSTKYCVKKLCRADRYYIAVWQIALFLLVRIYNTCIFFLKKFNSKIFWVLRQILFM